MALLILEKYTKEMTQMGTFCSGPRGLSGPCIQTATAKNVVCYCPSSLCSLETVSSQYIV